MKRCAGFYSWEITVGAGTSAKVGLHGATPTAQRAEAAQAAVTYASQIISDPPTRAEVQTLNDVLVAMVALLNELWASAVENGLVKGGKLQQVHGLFAVIILRTVTGVRAVRCSGNHHRAARKAKCSTECENVIPLFRRGGVRKQEQ